MSHQVVWFDIPATSLSRALAFYRGVLGVEFEESQWQGGGIGVLPHGPSDVAGCIFQTEESKPGQHGPLIYMNVNGRLQLAVDQVEALGGQILEPPQSIEPHGQRAIVLDSEGNRIALHSD